MVAATSLPGPSAWALGAWEVALDHAEHACALLRGAPPSLDLALALNLVAGSRLSRDASRARLELDEARSAANAIGADPLVGQCAVLTALALLYAGMPDPALPFAEEALAIGRGLRSEWLTATSLASLSVVAQHRGDLAAAHGYAAQALPLHRAMQNRWEAVSSLPQLAYCQAESGEAAAKQTWQAALAESIAIGHRHGAVAAVLGIAALLAADGQADRAARLLGAVEAQVEPASANMLVLWVQPLHDRALALTRAALPDAAFAQAWAEGQALSIDQAGDLALARPA